MREGCAHLLCCKFRRSHRACRGYTDSLLTKAPQPGLNVTGLHGHDSENVIFGAGHRAQCSLDASGDGGGVGGEHEHEEK